MPSASALSSSPSVKTSRPFLPMTMAVPVSWHIGKMPPAAMFAFFKRSKATNLSFPGGLRIGENFGKLGQMRRAQQMVDVAHRLFGEEPQRPWLDAQELMRPRISRPVRPRRSAFDRASCPCRERKADDTERSSLVRGLDILAVLAWAAKAVLGGDAHAHGTLVRYGKSRSGRPV